MSNILSLVFGMVWMKAFGSLFNGCLAATTAKQCSVTFGVMSISSLNGKEEKRIYGNQHLRFLFKFSLLKFLNPCGLHGTERRANITCLAQSAKVNCEHRI